MRDRIPNLFLATAILLLLCPLASAAEEELPLESFVDQVDVNIVNVEVFVTDREGRRVTGLTREDFELYEDDRPVEIANFYAMEPTPGEGGVPETATAEPRAVGSRPQEVPEKQRLSLLVFVDNLHLLPDHRVPVLKDLEAFLDERLVQGDRVMLLNFNGAINVVQTFTEDRQRIAEGIGKIGRSTAPGSSQLAMTQMTHRWARGTAMHALGRRQEGYTLMLSSIDAIEDAVRFLGTQSGRRAILYVSDGFSASGTNQSARHLFRRIPRMANAHLVTFYALDARGPQDSTLPATHTRSDAGEDTRTLRETNRDWDVEESMITMAAPTGGAAYSGTAHFAESLSRLGEDFKTFYSLGYASPSSGEVQFHKIDVRVRRKGLKVRHRGGYLEKPLEERVADRFLASVLLDQETNSLGIQLAVGEADSVGAKEYELPILIKIPSGLVTFLPREDVMEGRLRIFLAIQDENHKLALVKQLPYPMTVPLSEVGKFAAGEIGYQTKLKIGPGPRRIAAGVWDEISGMESFIQEVVLVGEPESSQDDG